MGKNNDKTWVLKLCENYHKHNATDEKQNLQNLCSTRPDIPIDIASLIFEYLPSPLNIEEIVPSIIKENTQTN